MVILVVSMVDMLPMDPAVEKKLLRCIVSIVGTMPLQVGLGLRDVTLKGVFSFIHRCMCCLEGRKVGGDIPK